MTRDLRDEVLARVRAALLPLDAMPEARGWNHEELADLLPAAATLREAAVLVGLGPPQPWV